MSRAPWICSRCILQRQKQIFTYGARFHNTDVSKGLSPAVLNRAQSMSVEHQELSKSLSTEYDSRTEKRIGELAGITDALNRWKEATKAIQELRALLDDKQVDEELRGLAIEDISSSQAELDKSTKSLTGAIIPKHPFSHLPCLIEIIPGAGGDEANIFAGDLLRMYRALCARKGFRTNLLRYEDADGQSDSTSSVPLTEAILEVESAGSYEDLRTEAGVHRVQRVPATESKGRTHTSAVSVLVLPSIPEESDSSGQDSWHNPTSLYYVDPKEVRTETMRARGAGGQHVNKTESAIRLTHIPTGTTVSIQDGRSQHQNREKAWRILRSRIAESRREIREKERANFRNSIVDVARAGRENKIRTYNWGQQRVTDHRSGLTVHDLTGVMEGGPALDTVIESVKAWLTEREVEELEGEMEGMSKTRKG